MAFEPEFSVTARLLQAVEAIAGLRERIAAATVQVAWIPALQKDARVRNTHSSTAIEGNPLTLEQVRELEEGRPLAAVAQRSQREVLNCFAGLRYMEKNAGVKTLTHEHVLKLHSIIAGGVMDQGDAGRYRSIVVRVGRHVPPPPEQVSGLMRELLDWWNKEAPKWSPVLSSAIVHFQFEDIHPFADGNGRTGRMLALWELYRRGFDTHPRTLGPLTEEFTEGRLAMIPSALLSSCASLVWPITESVKSCHSGVILSPLGRKSTVSLLRSNKQRINLLSDPLVHSDKRRRGAFETFARQISSSRRGRVCCRWLFRWWRGRARRPGLW